MAVDTAYTAIRVCVCAGGGEREELPGRNQKAQMLKGGGEGRKGQFSLNFPPWQLTERRGVGHPGVSTRATSRLFREKLEAGGGGEMHLSRRHTESSAPPKWNPKVRQRLTL